MNRNNNLPDLMGVIMESNKTSGNTTLKWLVGTRDRSPRNPFNRTTINRLVGEQSGDLTAYLEAAESYRTAMAVSPERINLLTSYEQVLNHLKRWKEADALSKRIIQLEAIYREK